MFIETMSPFAQSLTLSMGAKIVAADGKIADEEKALLDKLKAHCGASVETMPVKIADLSSMAEKLTRREKVGMLLELTALAFADGQFHESEHSALREIAVVLDLEDELDDIVEWVKRQILLIKEAEILMEE